MLFLVIIGPLTEELGWRGFALDHLEAKWSPLVSALILGAIWSVWHLPLFFIKGTSWGSMGFGSLRFFLFLPYHLSLSVLMTWLYNSNRRSIATAILVHFVANMAANILPATSTAFMFVTGLLAIAATLVVASGRMKRNLPQGCS
jgi:membrane protease YdiL (CAAX protease family)